MLFLSVSLFFHHYLLWDLSIYWSYTHFNQRVWLHCMVLCMLHMQCCTVWYFVFTLFKPKPSSYITDWTYLLSALKSCICICTVEFSAVIIDSEPVLCCAKLCVVYLLDDYFSIILHCVVEFHVQYCAIPCCNINKSYSFLSSFITYTLHKVLCVMLLGKVFYHAVP